MHRLLAWLDRNVLELGREMRIEYLPPLMVYVAAGVSGLTGIVGTFFIKEYLGLSAEFLAALGFWAGIPWALKMPVGHLVDLIWRWRSLLVYLGASLIAASLLIMYGLIAHADALRALWPIEHWFVLSALLAPVGYVLQDVVADAMTVEAVPQADERGEPTDAAARKLMHTTMQTLGRVAIIGGTVFVSLLNVWLFRDAQTLSQTQKAVLYADLYLMALVIPALSVAGTVLAATLRARRARAMAAAGVEQAAIAALLGRPAQAPAPNWWILGGSLVFAAVAIGVGLSDFAWSPPASRGPPDRVRARGAT